VPRLHGDEERFFVEGLSFPDAGFPGLVSFHVTLLDDSNEVGGGWAKGEKRAPFLADSGITGQHEGPQTSCPPC
jgi:hypothetical protein